MHPIHNSNRENATKDDKISAITSKDNEKLYEHRLARKKLGGRKIWHSDITFEQIPSDYTVLRLTQLPKAGGGESGRELRVRSVEILTSWI